MEATTKWSWIVELNLLYCMARTFDDSIKNGLQLQDDKSIIIVCPVKTLFIPEYTVV